MLNNIPVVLLCGGWGTRLGMESGDKPKPMVEVGDKPILWHIMNIYAFYGFRKFVLCLGYKGDMIRNYFLNFKKLNNDLVVKLDTEEIQFLKGRENATPNWEVVLVNTGVNALKGARLKRIEHYIDTEEFMVTYGDGLANINLNDLLKFHRERGRIVTLTAVRPPSRFGEIDIQGDRVRRFTEKPQISGGFINGGFFVCNRKIFDSLANNDQCDLEFGALEKLAEEGQVDAYVHTGEWECIDTVRDWNHLKRLWEGGKAFWKVW